MNTAAIEDAEMSQAVVKQAVNPAPGFRKKVLYLSKGCGRLALNVNRG
jgi:hypothetical protein